MSVLDNRVAHLAVRPDPLLGLVERVATPGANELRSEIAALVSHEMVLVDALSKAPGAARAAGPNDLTWLTDRRKGVDSRNLRHTAPNIGIQ